MKNLFLALFLSFGLLNSESQIGELSKFKLNKDTKKTVINKLEQSSFVENKLFDGVTVTTITVEDKLNYNKYEFKFVGNSTNSVDDTLYSMKFYPCITYNKVEVNSKKIKNCEKQIENYINFLNRNYEEIFNRQEWSDEETLIEYKAIRNDEFFIHYSKKLLEKYPKYK
jgi:hypothetical protein